MPRHAAEGLLALEERRLDSGAAEEVRRGDAGRTAADDGGLLAINARGAADGGHERAVAAFGSEELRVADADGVVIEVAAALRLAAVGADRAGDEGEGGFFSVMSFSAGPYSPLRQSSMYSGMSCAMGQPP